MNLNNSIERLSSLLVLLSKGYGLSTPEISKRLNLSKKIIQTDFKDYLLPLFSKSEIYYDYSDKVYKSKSNFLNKTLFSADELSIISILKHKSKDKYSEKDLSIKVDALIGRFEDELTNKFFQRSSIKNFDNAITAYFKPEIEAIPVQLSIDGEVSRYFVRKPLNKSQRIIKYCEDKSIELEIYVSDLMEIVPIIQRYIPHVGVISPIELIKQIQLNLDNYMKNIVEKYY